MPVTDTAADDADRLVEAYGRIPDPAVRESIIAMIEALADAYAPPDLDASDATGQNAET